MTQSERLEEIPIVQHRPGVKPAPKRLIVPFAEIRPRPNQRQLIKGLLGASSLGLIYGPTGCGKTNVTTALAFSVARSEPFAGRRVEGGPILYCALEGGSGFLNRVEAYRIEHGLEDASVPFYIPAADQIVDLTRDGAEKIISLCREIELEAETAVVLVVIDTLARAMPDGRENETEGMGPAIIAATRIQNETGAAVLIVHHSGKDADRGPRGSSSLSAAVDSEFRIERDTATKIITLTPTKQRDMDIGQPLYFSLNVIDIGVDSDGDVVTSCIALAADPPGAPTSCRPRLANNPQIILDALTIALDRAGRPAPASNYIPNGKIVVEVGQWRAIAYDRLGGEAEGTRQKAFSRAKAQLQAKGLIGISQDLVWLA